MRLGIVTRVHVNKISSGSCGVRDKKKLKLHFVILKNLGTKLKLWRFLTVEQFDIETSEGY